VLTEYVEMSRVAARPASCDDGVLVNSREKQTDLICAGDRKKTFDCHYVKEVDLYSASSVVLHTQGAHGMDHTVLPANYTVPASTS